MTGAGAIVEHSASNRGAFQDNPAVGPHVRETISPAIDYQQLAEAIVRLVNEDPRVGKAILDLVLTCPNVVVQY
jgi:hypothetical protein